MRESDKGMKGDHRIMSDPTAERKDFIKHVSENAAKDEKKESKDSSKDKSRENNQKR